MPAGKITALRAQVNDSQRVNVFLNGSFAIGVSLNTITKEGLFVGKEVTAEDFERLAVAENADKAYIAALRLLESRPRSTAELRDRLRRKEFAPEAIDGAISRLERLGMVDDAAFARFWVENRQIINPRGAGALRYELRRKGIDKTIADAILDDDELVGDQATQAMELARKALRKYANSPDKMTFTRRLGGFLQRRGFGFDVARPAIDTLWQELRDRNESDDDAEIYDDEDE